MDATRRADSGGAGEAGGSAALRKDGTAGAARRRVRA
jgi:hypothetical protein